MKKYIYSTLISALAIVGCHDHPHGHSHDTVGGHAHEEEHGHPHEEELSISHTIWTDKSELFVEFKPLVVGEVSRFAAHFTDLTDHSPVTKGSVTVSLVNKTKGIRQSVKSPSSPGIFTPSLKPVSPGAHSLVFEIITSNFSDKIVIDNVVVFESMDDAKNKTPHEEESPNSISFLKEQAWKMEFSTESVQKGTIFNSVKVGGEILPAQGDERTISATASGIVFYNSNGISIGKGIKESHELFTISGNDLSEDNIQAKFNQAKATFDQSKLSFERKSKLFKSQAISNAEYDKAKMDFEIAQSEYNKLAKNFTKNGKSVVSNSSGFIKQLLVSEGEYVEIGQPLAVITKNQKLTIKATVSQSDHAMLSDNISANFQQGDNVFSLESLGGELLSFGKSVSANEPQIPVLFQMNNKGDIFPGGYVSVWIKSTPINNALTISNSAIMEEYGVYSVIVQLEGETFEKRQVSLGVSDGIRTQVLAGLNEGERIVTQGAYQVKMASMSGQVPAHGHSH